MTLFDLSRFEGRSRSPEQEEADKREREYLAKLHQCNSSTTLTYAPELEPDSSTLPHKLHSSEPLQPAKLTPTANESLSCDSQNSRAASRIPEGSQPTLSTTNPSAASTSLPPRHRASRSQLQENAEAQPMTATASQPSSKSSESSNQVSSQLRTSPAYSLVLTAPETLGPISNFSSKTFPASGTMRNGQLCQAELSALPGEAIASCWLPRPTALSWSGRGRPPGKNKSESAAEQLGLLQKSEVYNPELLEIWFGLPRNWTSPQELRPAAELREAEGNNWAMLSILELRESPSNESSISRSEPKNITVEKPNISPTKTVELEQERYFKHLEDFEYLLENLSPVQTDWGEFYFAAKTWASREHRDRIIWENLEVLILESSLNERLVIPYGTIPFDGSRKPPVPEIPEAIAEVAEIQFRKPFWIEVVEEKKRGRPKGMKNFTPASGSLGPFVERRNGKTYPIVEGDRVDMSQAFDYPRQFNWLYNWSIQDEDGCWKNRSKRVKPSKVHYVKYAIAADKPIEEILEFIDS